MWLVKIILDSRFSALDPTINGVSTFGSPSLNRCLCHKHMQGVKKQLSYTSTRTCLLGQPRNRGYSLGELYVPYFSKVRASISLREWPVNNNYISGYGVGRIRYGVTSLLDQIYDGFMTYFRTVVRRGQVVGEPSTANRTQAKQV